MSPILKKSHKKSFIKRFHITSEYAERVFNESSNKLILQVMELADGELVAELIDKEDYYDSTLDD